MSRKTKLANKIKKIIKGDVTTTRKDRTTYSHDASLFRIKPDVIAFPKDVADVCSLVNFVNDHKKSNPGLSLTGRSGGTDMTGGAINDSIIVAFERYFKHIGDIKDNQITVQPGVYYRDFEPVTMTQNLLMPSYPASREICMIGGMVANNAGGEKSLIYGKTDRYVTKLKIVLRDGKEHVFEPLSGQKLKEKMEEKSLEGKIYREIYNLVTKNQQLIKAAKPNVTKNSTAYNVWDAWDGTTLDINKLIIGSQGTLGLLTEVTFRLVPAKPLSGMLVAFLPTTNNLGKIINSVLSLKPTSLESFDDHTLLFAFRFFMSFRQTLGWKKFILLGLSFIPVLNKMLRLFPRLPKIVLLVVFEGDTQEEINAKIAAAKVKLSALDIETHEAPTKEHEEKFWTMRRESFNLLRKNVKQKHTAPFVDDLIVPPENLPEFLPKLSEILDRYKLTYTIAGHMGDGNFHIIPLMNLRRSHERNKIYPVLKEVTDLVLKYNGSLSGEHNDGLIRGPVLEQMYGSDMMELFKKIKYIFDPENIFNPHKKTDATQEFSQSHIKRTFLKTK